MKQLIILTAIFLISFSGLSQTEEIDGLTLQLSFQKPDTTKVDMSIRLIQSLYNLGNYKKAESYINKTGMLAVDLKYKKGIADLKYLKALIYTQKDDYYNAIDFFKRSLRIYEDLKDFLGIAKVNNSIALIEIKRGNYTKGLSYSLSATEILEEKDLKDDLSIAYENLAIAYFNINKIDEALSYNFKNLGIKQELNDTEGIKTITNNIAMLYAMQNDHKNAVNYYDKTLELLDPKTDRELRAEILPLLGKQYLKLDKLNLAQKYLIAALNLNKRLKNKKGTLKSLNNIANLNIRKNRVIIARRQINEAYGIAKDISDDDELLENYRLRISLDSVKKNYKQVIKWQKRYYELKENLLVKNIPPLVIFDDIENEKEVLVNKVVSDTITPSLASNKNTLAITKNNSAYLLYALIASLALLIIAIFIGIARVRKTKKSTEKLKSENTELKLYSDNTETQVSQLKDTNSVKDKLFSIVSHDLKDSITSVKAFLDLLKDKSISKEEFEELIPELSSNADNASALLMNLLNWSKSQLQNLDPEPEAFNIQDVFKEKITLIQKKADQKQVKIIDESNKDIVFADKSMIEIVVQNLLANAVKFSKVGDSITLSNKQRNGKALICIEDTGVGISKENQEKLFKNQGFTTPGTDHEKGTGLGLSICKELVELNKGNIWVESELNLGSCFFIELLKSEAIHKYFKNIEVNTPVVLKTLQS